MGSLSRKMKRQKIRNDFGRFSDEYRNVKNRQIEEGGPREGEYELKKKPSYSMFIKLVAAKEEQRRRAVLDELQQRKDEEKNIDLEWKDE